MNSTKLSRLVGATSGVAVSLILLVGGGSTSIEAVNPPEEGSTPSEMPRTIEHSEDMPLWVAAEEAVSGGRLRAEHFPEFHFERLKEEVEQLRAVRARSGITRKRREGPATQADCSSYTVSGGSGPYLGGKPIGLESLFEWAEVVVIGEVTSRAEGFLGGFPASLYRLAVERVLKAPSGVEVDSVAYFDYPLTSIEVEGEIICNRPRTFPRVPKPARRALVFGHGILKRSPTVISAGGTTVVFEDGHGDVVFPRLEGAS